MTKKSSENTHAQYEGLEIFNSAHQLQLIQLQTRQVINDREEQKARESAKHADPGEIHQEVKETEIPKQWRLIPKDVSLHEWQEQCLPKWLQNGRGTVKVATGAGKTLFALSAAQKLQNSRDPDLRLVVIVPTIPLMHQWCAELSDSNLTSTSIGLMGDGNYPNSLVHIRVLICVLASARDRLESLIKAEDWGRRMLLVVDECHRSNADKARKIFNTTPRYTLGLSATPEQEYDSIDKTADTLYNESAVGQALGPIIFDFTIRDAMKANLLPPFEVWHVGVTLNEDESARHAGISREISALRRELLPQYKASSSKQSFIPWCQTKASRNRDTNSDAGKFMSLTAERKRLLYQVKARAELTLCLLSKTVTEPKSQAIVFHESIDEIQTLFIRAIENDIPAVLEHSGLPKSVREESIEAFRQGVARVIVSARSLVEGFNVPSADVGIIMASSSSVRQRIQSLGRMLRRKEGGEIARVYVIYVRQSVDESIYEKADWEDVIGAKRNRYFEWCDTDQCEDGQCQLTETNVPPRVYRPLPSEVDVSALAVESPYPARTDGVDLKVDQELNLRTDSSKVLVKIPTEIIKSIQNLNSYGRAKYTDAGEVGHLIVRTNESNGQSEWLFLCEIEKPVDMRDGTETRYRIRQISGKRQICRLTSKQVLSALPRGVATSNEAGEAQFELLKWIQEIEGEKNLSVLHLYWDNKGKYWLEVCGEKVIYESELPPLEFKS